jgi:uncharacterized membrane protein YtjA (UPF0391 family)
MRAPARPGWNESDISDNPIRPALLFAVGEDCYKYLSLPPNGGQTNHVPSIGTQEVSMLYYSVVFLVIALIAGALGFLGIAGAAVGIAKILFFVFIVLFLVSLIMGRRGSAPL